MSLYTCIYSCKDLNDIDKKDKDKIYHILHKSHVQLEGTKTNNSKLKRILRLFYILDIINKHLSNDKKIVIKDIEHDKHCRELIKEYIGAKLKLIDIENEMKNSMDLNCEYNPLEYSSNNFEPYYADNNLVNYLFDKYGSGKLAFNFDLYKGSIIGTNDIYKIKEILNYESEEK